MKTNIVKPVERVERSEADGVMVVSTNDLKDLVRQFGILGNWVAAKTREEAFDQLKWMLESDRKKLESDLNNVNARLVRLTAAR